MRESEARHLKDWRLNKARRTTRRVLEDCRERAQKSPEKPGLSRIMIEPLERELQIIEAEIARRKTPAFTNGDGL